MSVTSVGRRATLSDNAKDFETIVTSLVVKQACA